MDHRNKSLGQFFTPNSIAVFMANIIEKKIKEGGSILDPCIGQNIFLKNIKSKYSLTGVEIDKTIIDEDINKFFKHPSRKLILDDFLTYEFKDKFDAIISNPPYLRHEVLSEKQKKYLKKIANQYSIVLDSKSNYFVYFLLKSLNLLSKSGYLVTIIYDSILYTKYGKDFLSYVISNFCVEEIYHFENNIFKDVMVGAVILVIKNENKNKLINYYKSSYVDQIRLLEKFKYNNKQLIDFKNNNLSNSIIFENTNLFNNFKLISEKKIFRGSETPKNKYFIFKTNINNKLKKIIKKVNSSSLVINNEDITFTLDTSKNENFNKEIIDKIKLSAEKDKNLDFFNKKNWTYFKINKGGNILFNYYFRNPKFIYNKNGISTLGNFYNLFFPKELVLIYFALLNSSLTKIGLKVYSKKQGSGLYKIQLKEFNNLPVINIDIFNKNDLKKLNAISSKHINNQNSVFPTIKIDSIIFSALERKGVNIKEIKTFLDSYE